MTYDMEDTEITYEWPENYPDGVPPENSIPANGKVYRLVDKFPPDENDFLMSIEEPRYKGKKNFDSIFYSVSFFSEYSSIIETRSNYPAALKEKKVAVGKLVSTLGKTSEPSKKNHIHLWKCTNSKPHLHINKEVKNK